MKPLSHARTTVTCNNGIYRIDFDLPSDPRERQILFLDRQVAHDLYMELEAHLHAEAELLAEQMEIKEKSHHILEMFKKGLGLH